MEKVLQSPITKSNIKKSKFFKNENLLDVIFTILTFLIMIIIIINPKKYTSGTISGLKLFFYSVLPGLLPFMLLTKIITELGIVEKFFSKFDKLTFFLFGTPGISLYVLFMSILSGYPIGAKIISDLYSKNIISSSDAKKMSIFCTTSGPIFVIGSVGTIMFGSYRIGLILYFSHILSSILLGIICHIFDKNKQNSSKNNKNMQFFKRENIINFAINETISSLFIVCAYITIFYLIGEILDYLKVFYLISKPINLLFSKLNLSTNYTTNFLYGILEVTRGVKNLSVNFDNVSIILSSGILSFSGLSIIFQSMSFLKQASVKTYKFILFKILHSILSIILCFAFLKIF